MNDYIYLGIESTNPQLGPIAKSRPRVMQMTRKWFYMIGWFIAEFTSLSTEFTAVLLQFSGISKI